MSSIVGLMMIVLLVALMVIGILFMLNRINNDRIKYLLASNSDDFVKRGDFDKLLKKFVKQKKNYFVFTVNITDTNKLMDKLSGEQVVKMLNILVGRYIQVLNGIFTTNGKNSIQVLTTMELDSERIQEICTYILDESLEPVQVDNLFYLQLAYNVSVVGLRQAKDFSQLRSYIVMASSNAISLGPNEYYLFENALDGEGETVKMALDIKKAISENEFVLMFHETYAKSGEVQSIETYLKWRRGDEIIPAAKFFPILSKTDDFYTMTLWIFKHALEEFKEMQQRTGITNVVLSINISQEQLAFDKLASDVRNIIKASQVPFESIALELTGMDVLDNSDLVRRNCQALQNYGVKIYFDDYKFGLSGLDKILKYGINGLKVDRKTFENTMTAKHQAGLAKVLIDFGKENNVLVIAKVMETEEMLNFAKEMGYEYFQGYVLSKPKFGKEIDFQKKNI